jgi:membrane protease YdiL (CAAX protease family)
MTAFIIVAFALSWAWALPLAALGDAVEKGRGWPTHFPALLGPALAALAVTAWASGTLGVRDLLSRMARWQIPVRWWAAALSPLAFLALALVTVALAGTFPAWGEFGRYSGLPAVGVVGVVLIATLVNGLGEETGWRGFLLPLLQRRHTPLAAALLLTPIWALWHLPYFFLIASYRDLAPPAYVGFVFALGCGSVILAWLYNRTGGSILACAVWHASYNLTTATAAADQGAIAAVTSAFVVIQAIVLVRLELRARRRGWSVLGRRATPALEEHVGRDRGAVIAR